MSDQRQSLLDSVQAEVYAVCESARKESGNFVILVLDPHDSEACEIADGVQPNWRKPLRMLDKPAFVTTMQFKFALRLPQVTDAMGGRLAEIRDHGRVPILVVGAGGVSISEMPKPKMDFT